MDCKTFSGEGSIKPSLPDSAFSLNALRSFVPLFLLLGFLEHYTCPSPLANLGRAAYLVTYMHRLSLENFPVLSCVKKQQLALHKFHTSFLSSQHKSWQILVN